VDQPLNDATGFRITGVYEDSESFRDGLELRRKGINATLAIRTGESSRIILGSESPAFRMLEGVPAIRSIATAPHSSAIQQAATPGPR